MNILEIIKKKRDKKELTKDEIKFFIEGYVKGIVADYQASALVMAIFLNGMTDKETTDLTLAMANSGEMLDLSFLGKIIVDKHSTGGVGDKVSLILLPLVASLGVPVAKMSGRGLGFTGGTVDKLESIPGYRTDLEISHFLKNVEKIGISMISQTMNLAPADKKMYALRDSISCVESIPLIASSIMSKKIASGAQKIVLDVTVGKGAFMKDMESARILADKMISIGKLAGRDTVAVLTNMDEPLGYAVGNILEVKEAVHFLKGEKIPDVEQVVLELGAYMVYLAGLGDDLIENKKKLYENIQNGKAYEKFLQLVKEQGGVISYIENLEKFETSKHQKEVKCINEGYVQEIDAEKIGKIACFLGAGRIKKEDDIDPTVGIVLKVKVGNKVQKGETVAILYANDEEKLNLAERQIQEIINIVEEPVQKKEAVLEVKFH